MWRIFLYIALLFTRHTHGDHSDNRSDGYYNSIPIDSRNGSFLSPRGYATIWPPGSKMTITWNSSSFNLKLILYQRNLSGIDASSSYIPDPEAQDQGRYVWTVDRTWDDYTSPYVLRGLDAGADEGSMLDNFWTPMFYIGDTEWGSSTRILPSTRTSSSLSSRSSTRTQSVGMWGFSTAIATPTSTFRTTTPTADESTQRTPLPPPGRWERNPGDLSESAAIGLLIGITLAVVGIIICLITMFLNRLQRKEAEKPKLVPVNTSEDELMSGGARGYTRVPEASPVEMDVSPTELEITPVEMEGSRICAEMDARRERPRVEDLDELVV